MKHYVSRQGLVQCPRCERHIKLEQTPEQTRCPFCERNAKRKGVAAAAVLALGVGVTVAACGGEAVTPLYGQVPADAGVMPDGGVNDGGQGDTN